MNRLPSALTFVTLLSSSALTQGPWTIDRSHSSISFAVSHMVISEVTGKFREFDITFASGKDDFTDGQIRAVIQAGSINTENERRDNHLKSGDFFRADSFPTITFTSTGFEKTGEKTYNIRGNLTIRGTTNPVVFAAVHNGTVRSQREVRTGWTATLTLNRFEYGLKWDRALETGAWVAGETVKITVNAEFRKEKT